MTEPEAVVPVWTNELLEKQLHNLYYAAGDPGSYGGVERLYTRARELDIPVTRQLVERFLSKQLPYSIHKPVRHKFQRNHTFVANIDQQWQADLADMQALAAENDGYRYILTCIDILSRYAWAIPVRSKSTKDMLVAFKRLEQTARSRFPPQRLQTDKGKEFFNTQVSAFLRDHNVHHFASNSDQKAAVVERFNRTLKSRIWTYFTANDTKRYVNILGDIVHAYNHTTHRSIGMHPADVDNEAAAQKAWMKLFYRDTSKIHSSEHKPLSTGKLARITRWKGDFEKGYLPNWSREHFIVKQRIAHPHTVYKIEDTSGEPIEGAFYDSELQAIPRNTLQVEQVIRRRKRGTQAEVLVKWRGWADKFNRWIPQHTLENYKTAPVDRHQLTESHD